MVVLRVGLACLLMRRLCARRAQRVRVDTSTLGRGCRRALLALLVPSPPPPPRTHVTTVRLENFKMRLEKFHASCAQKATRNQEGVGQGAGKVAWLEGTETRWVWHDVSDVFLACYQHSPPPPPPP